MEPTSQLMPCSKKQSSLNPVRGVGQKLRRRFATLLSVKRVQTMTGLDTSAKAGIAIWLLFAARTTISLQIAERNAFESPVVLPLDRAVR